MGMERRWGTRKPVEVNVVIDNQPMSLLPGQIGDVSIGGLFVKTEATALRMNAPVELVLLLDTEGNTRVYRLPAIVVRLTGDGAGLMFDQYDVTAFRTLVMLLLSRQNTEQKAHEIDGRPQLFSVRTDFTEDEAPRLASLMEGA
ncbi:MAG: PilZ domain-containing protein [Gammaproteobacteria bacterium]|nr:PilZ domain-containing protein [Gammaproteobacteria bacterium]